MKYTIHCHDFNQIYCIKLKGDFTVMHHNIAAIFNLHILIQFNSNTKELFTYPRNTRGAFGPLNNYTCPTNSASVLIA